MSRIAYKNDGWVDHNGPRPDINFKPPCPNDYYFHVPSSEVVLRWFGEECGAGEPLGEIYTVAGRKVADIPPFVHPACRGMRQSYRSRMAWVQEFSGDTLSFVVHCSITQDFRLKLNLKTLEYSDPEFGVR